MTLLIDSPFSNLDSMGRGLARVGADLRVSSDPRAIAAARCIVLPGVGAYAVAMGWLERSGVAAALRDAVSAGASLLGVCLGHQLLFDDSDEMGATRGLGFIHGSVRRFPEGVRVPKIGWNRVAFDGDPLFDGIASGTSFYFVHSFRAVSVAPSSEIATADYGGAFNAAARQGRVCGVQFHPEKSSSAGLRLLENFLEAAGDRRQGRRSLDDLSRQTAPACRIPPEV
jgi:glutamine amidotransferase